MRSNLFSNTKKSECNIFKNEDALHPEFVPDALPGRESEVKEIASCLEPLAEGGVGESVFLHGPPGTGKTASARFVCRELQNYSQKTTQVFVNCWHESTRQAVLSTVARAFGEPLPRRGLASDEFFSRIIQNARNTRRSPLVVLDEFDRLAHAGQHAVIYDFARASETHGVAFTLILISNNADALQRLDERALSSLRPRPIEFKRYSPLELKKILSERAAIAFHEGTCPKNVLALCAAFAAKKGGDARIALKALFDAAKHAERRGASEICESDARVAFGEQEPRTASQAKRLIGLSKVEEEILGVLRKAENPLSSGELYRKLASGFTGREGAGVSERSLRDYLNLLVTKRLIVAEEARGESGRGKTRLFRLA
ncbi:MAG: AAA family ATPase [Candidatus Norongarragalinales archaeon]